MLSFTEIQAMFDQVCEEGKRKYTFCIKQLGYKLEMNNRKTSVGVCYFNKGVISLSRHYATDSAMVLNTIRHEIAHAYASALYNDRGHGEHWRRICIELGGCGNVKNNTVKVVEGKYKLIDTTTGKVVDSYHRKPKGTFERAYIKGRPETVGKLVLVMG